MYNPLKTKTCFLLLLLILGLQSTGFSQPVQEIKIGVLAKRGPELTLKKWSATADYLSSTLPGYHFNIIPLGFTEIHTAVKEERIDFVLANPAFYVELEKRYGVNRIATLINQDLPGQQTTIFGGVIFARADRSDIQSIRDLQGKSFMAVEQHSFGGWIVCWRELQRRGLDPARFFGSLRYGNTHDAVVHAVRNSEVDGGTVRTDTLERMAEAGTINLQEFRILNEQQSENFPFKFSTALYPEWPFAATKSTSIDLSRRVASALLSMNADEPAAKASKSAGWTVPLNYQPVHDCLLELRIGPYSDFGQFTFSDVVRRYWPQLVLLLFILTLVVSTSLYILQLNRNLKQKKAEVDELNKTLEAKVEERTQKVNILLDQELYLREIMETIAEVNGLLLSSADLKTLLQEACKIMCEHGHYGYSWIGIMENGKVDTVFTSDASVLFPSDPPYDPFDTSDPFSSTPAAQCMINSQTIVVEKSSTVLTVSPWLDRAAVTGYRAVAALPLRADKYTPPLGAFSVYTLRPEGFEEEELAMLEELAGDIGFAVSSFRQREMVARLETERAENYEETILSFANMIDHRDTYTAGHTLRVAHYCKLLAREMGVSEEKIGILQQAATLHDIGKIATPDSVLLKPGKLSTLDYDLIKLHASAGYEMLSNITMYKELAGIIRHHHERYDGTGYPDQLRGKDIPPLSRIIVVADSFDAMTTNRIYKPRKEIAEALKELKQLSGIQFDPEVVKVAAKVLKDVQVPKAITQLPKTQMEKRRFSYFFSDKITGLYNEDYLQIILRNNKELHDYHCLHSLHIRDLQHYNQVHGWEQGNILMQKFALELQERYQNSLLFRTYGQYFVIISRKHFEMNAEALLFESLKGSGVHIKMDHLDLKKDTAYYMHKMEKIEIQSGVEA
ncbi:MAG: PhnD/SsuA/transferrin family substrate-binding protein [Desulfocapsa sp.]|nr:PhnD/SsuA/transferrin family substrate-binding protein [Desulfocapsa sp.]